MPGYAGDMPEGDALLRAAQRLQVLVGQRVEVETPHPRAAVKHLAERLDGLTLQSVEAVGKNLLLRFDGGLVLHSQTAARGAALCAEKTAGIYKDEVCFTKLTAKLTICYGRATGVGAPPRSTGAHGLGNHRWGKSPRFQKRPAKRPHIYSLLG